MICLVGCGTILKQSPKNVRLTSTPSGASYRVLNSAGSEVFTTATTASLYRFGIEINDSSYTLYNREGTIHSIANRNSEGYYNFTSPSGQNLLITSDMFLYDADRSMIEVKVNATTSLFTPTNIRWQDDYDKVSFSLADFPSQTASLKTVPSFWGFAAPIILAGTGAGLYLSNNERQMPSTVHDMHDVKKKKRRSNTNAKIWTWLNCAGGYFFNC